MWLKCLARATIALVGLGLLGMVTSAAAHSPHALAPADAASAAALAARAPNPMEADMVALVAASPVAVAVAPAIVPAAPVVVAVAPAARPAPAPAPQAAAPPHRAPSAPPASLRLAAAQPPAVAAPPLPAAARAVETALKELGKPYRYGTLGPSTFDCSGLTKFAYGTVGISLPHSAAAQRHQPAALGGRPVSVGSPGQSQPTPAGRPHLLARPWPRGPLYWQRQDGPRPEDGRGGDDHLHRPGRLPRRGAARDLTARA